MKRYSKKKPCYIETGPNKKSTCTLVGITNQRNFGCGHEWVKTMQWVK